MKTLISFFETAWNIGVILCGVTYFGGVTAFVYKLGESALSLHQKGLVSLVDLNCSLQGDKLPEQCQKHNSLKRH